LSKGRFAVSLCNKIVGVFGFCLGCFLVKQDKDTHKLDTGASGDKKAMGKMLLPAGTDLAAEVLRLKAELENTRKELVAERAKVVDLEMRLGASSEVLSRSVIRDLVGTPPSLPAGLVSYLNERHRKRGRRSPVLRGLDIENHERIWRNLNAAIDSKVEASRIVTGDCNGNCVWSSERLKYERSYLQLTDLAWSESLRKHYR
jgi:hypothetical protein